MTDPTATKTYSFLVIEDNQAMAILTQELLEERGHTVQIAYNGESGVQAAREDKPQVIICDIRLFGSMSGYDVVQALKNDPSITSFVIALSAHQVEMFEDKAKDAGFDYVMTKPLDVDLLERTLAERL